MYSNIHISSDITLQTHSQSAYIQLSLGTRCNLAYFLYRTPDNENEVKQFQ
jgi:hypothetical protein